MTAEESVRLKLNFGETIIESTTNKASKIADATKYFFNLKRNAFRAVVYR
jgi:hypothetical protein